MHHQNLMSLFFCIIAQLLFSKIIKKEEEEKEL